MRASGLNGGVLGAWADAAWGGARDADAWPRTAARRLRALLRYAAAQSPHYGEAFRAAGVRPEDISGPEDLPRLPVLRSAEAREQLARLASRELDLARCPRRKTNGTTGHPLYLPCTSLENRFELWLWTRGYLSHGLTLRARVAKFAITDRMPHRPHLVQRLGMLRRVYCSVAEPVAEKIRFLREQRPDAVVCWASTMDEIAIELQRRGERLPLPLVFCTSDMLWPEARARIEAHTGARVVDVYGSLEMGPAAWPHPSGIGHRTDPEFVLLETVDAQNRPAESGRLLCTVLWRRGFPIIRCETGDLGRLCPGDAVTGFRPWLRELQGREQDLVRLPDGTTLSAGTLKGCIIGIKHMLRYQFIQDGADSFLLHLVPDRGFTDDAAQRIIALFADNTQGRCRLRVHLAERIHYPPEWKFTTLIAQARLSALAARGYDVQAHLRTPGRVIS